MKTVTLNVPESVYQEFQVFAKLQDRTAAELIREAMEEYRRKNLQHTPTQNHLHSFKAGGVIQPIIELA